MFQAIIFLPQELDTKEAEEEEVEVIAVDGGEWVVAQGGAAGETRPRWIKPHPTRSFFLPLTWA